LRNQRNTLFLQHIFKRIINLINTNAYEMVISLYAQHGDSHLCKRTEFKVESGGHLTINNSGTINLSQHGDFETVVGAIVNINSGKINPHE